MLADRRRKGYVSQARRLHTEGRSETLRPVGVDS